MDGLELYERVREDDRFSAMSVLFLTGQGEADIPENVGYVHKPFKRSELLERLSGLE